MHPAMRHLFGSWSTVFPLSILQKIKSDLQFSSSVNHQSLGLPSLRDSESQRPTHGIHINPTYLEARRQFGHEVTDSSFQPPRGISTTSKIYTQKHSTDFEEFNSDDENANVLLVRSNRLASRNSRSGPDAMKLLPTFGGRIERSSALYGLGRVRSSSPSSDEWHVNNSPGRGALPLESGIDYEIGGLLSSSDTIVGWDRNFVSGDFKNHVRHHAAVRSNNGVDVDRTRALIHAYGIDKRKEMTKHPNVEELLLNGIPTMTWQNSEEEEFDWENMSQTSADHSRKDAFSSSRPPSGSFRSAAPSASHLREDWPRQPQYSEGNVSSIVVSSSTDVLKNTLYGIHNGPIPSQSSSNLQESWKSAHSVNHSSTHQFNATKGGINPWMPFGGSGVLPPPIEHNPPSTGYSPKLKTQNKGPLFGSRGGSVSLGYVKLEQGIVPEPASAGAWPSTHLHSSHALPMFPTYQRNTQIRGQLDTLSGNNLLVNQDVHRSSFSDHNFDRTESILLNHMLPFSGQQFRPIPFNHSFVHRAMFRPHSPRDMPDHLAPPTSVVGLSPLLAPQLQRGYAPGHMESVGTIVPNSSMQSPLITRLHGVPLPLPCGLPGASCMLPVSEPSSGSPNQPVDGDYSSLFSSLMAQGVISLNQTPAKEDLVGLEFKPDLLKVRHNSAITALYLDLPRQCTTCGLRFKLQEAHSSHMDWHVTKNRVARNRKQKPSRKWFVNVNMWLTGAEVLGTDSVPNYLPSEDIVEKKDDEELAVPADDEQKYCALCGEPFDDFYSDETDEWMYKDAVYMNGPSSLTTQMERSQLGPIIHAKCRSETVILSEDIKKRDLDFTEEDSQQKRMRI